MVEAINSLNQQNIQLSITQCLSVTTIFIINNNECTGAMDLHQCPVSTVHIWFNISTNQCFKRKNSKMKETKEKSECNITSGRVCSTLLDDT